MVWISALVLGDFVVVSNILYAIDEIQFSTLLLSIIINASIVIVTFVGLEYYKSYYFSGFPYL